MAGIRTNAAAEMLGVSASTLRGWEQRHGFPHPQRTQGNHRHYDLGELEALRDALGETGSVSAAIEVARRRGRATASPARLIRAFESFDEQAADLEMEQSLALRSLDRSVEELLLPALDVAAERFEGGAELEFATRWATGWLHSARRLVASSTRAERVLLLDAGPPAGPEAVHTQALELALRRAGIRVLLLSATLDERQFKNAVKALQPEAVVLCGTDSNLNVLAEPLRHLIREGDAAKLFGYRGARLVSGSEGVPDLGGTPGEATELLLAELRAISVA